MATKKTAVKKKPAAPVKKAAAKTDTKKSVKSVAVKKPAAKPAAKTAKPAPKPAAKPVKAVAKPAPKAKAAPVKTVAKVVEKPKAVEKTVKPVAAPQKPVMKTAKVTLPVAKAETVKIEAPKPEKFEKPEFVTGDYVVYPAHGVGLIEGIETQKIAGMDITLYTIVFEKDRMRLKLPLSKVKTSGLRKLSSKDRLKDALSTLQGRSKVRRTMWSRRAQEYETKINSGDPVAIAEVLRDLRRTEDPSDQSYSERQIYQAALERLARELAAIEKIDEKKAAEKLEIVLGVTTASSAA